MTDDTLSRWKSFVAKTTERYQGILTESNAGFEGLLQDPNLDPITFLNAMNAIQIRVKDLRTKLGDVYTENVVGAIHVMREAEQVMNQTSEWMDDNFEHWRVSWNGKLIRSLWTRVQPLMHAPKSCSKCGAELTNRTVFHQAESIGCKHCQAMNSVSPDGLVYTYFAMAPDMIADEATMASKIQLERQRNKVSKGQIVEMARQHWRAYVTARAQIAPMSAEEQDRFVESKVGFETKVW